jgi:hypothetical protein
MLEPVLDAQRCAGLWVAVYRGRPIAAHPDARVLEELMAAEGLGGMVRYVKDDGHGESQLAAVGD